MPRVLVKDRFINTDRKKPGIFQVVFPKWRFDLQHIWHPDPCVFDWHYLASSTFISVKLRCKKLDTNLLILIILAN